MCTYAHAAPEILKQSTYNFKCDVFSAGVVMYESLQEDLQNTVIGVTKHDSMANVFPRTQEFIAAVASQVQNSDIMELALIHEMLQECLSACRWPSPPCLELRKA